MFIFLIYVKTNKFINYIVLRKHMANCPYCKRKLAEGEIECYFCENKISDDHSEEHKEK